MKRFEFKRGLVGIGVVCLLGAGAWLVSWIHSQEETKEQHTETEVLMEETPYTSSHGTVFLKRGTFTIPSQKILLAKAREQKVESSHSLQEIEEAASVSSVQSEKESSSNWTSQSKRIDEQVTPPAPTPKKEMVVSSKEETGEKEEALIEKKEVVRLTPLGNSNLEFASFQEAEEWAYALYMKGKGGYVVYTVFYSDGTTTYTVDWHTE